MTYIKTIRDLYAQAFISKANSYRKEVYDNIPRILNQMERMRDVLKWYVEAESAGRINGPIKDGNIARNIRVCAIRVLEDLDKDIK